jgi:thiol-disulfide isomerase/thioredoxin
MNGRQMLAGWLTVLLMSGVAAAGTGATIGRAAPALRLPQLDGSEFDLARQHGKVVILNYWATWCSPCRAEMPVLESFYKRHRAEGLVLLGVSVDDARDRAAVAALMQHFSYPAALAGEAKSDGFGPPLAVPTTYVIDAAGVVRARLMSGSAITEQTLEQLVLPLLPGSAH